MHFKTRTFRPRTLLYDIKLFQRMLPVEKLIAWFAVSFHSFLSLLSVKSFYLTLSVLFIIIHASYYYLDVAAFSLVNNHVKIKPFGRGRSIERFRKGMMGYSSFIPIRHNNIQFQTKKSLNYLFEVYIEEAEDDFVGSDELEEGEKCLSTVKAFASSIPPAMHCSSAPSHNGIIDYNNGNSDDYDNDDEEEENATQQKRIFLCAGALVQRSPPQQLANQHQRSDYNECDHIVCDAWIADATDGAPNLQLQGALLVLDELFCHFLKLENNSNSARLGTVNKNKESDKSTAQKKCRWTFVVQCGDTNNIFTCASHQAAIARGFCSLDDGKMYHSDDEYDWDEGMIFNYSVGIHRYTTSALTLQGTKSGNKILEILSYLSKNRRSYDFQKNGGEKSSSGTIISTNRQQSLPQCIIDEHVHGTIIAKLNGIITRKKVQIINSILNDIKNEDGLCFDPDSVDGLPSLHLSLVADGEILIENVVKDNAEDSDFSTKLERKASKLLDYILPCVNNSILPIVQRILNSTTIQVSDIFLRCYGDDYEHAADSIKNSRDGGESRLGIPAHYDVFSLATVVIPLDDSAVDGENGLYTLISSDFDDRQGVTNHAALRRYFQLQPGDAIFHTWDVQHGVDIADYSGTRSSLVIWFTEGSSSGGDEEKIRNLLMVENGNSIELKSKKHDYNMRNSVEDESYNNDDARIRENIESVLKRLTTKVKSNEYECPVSTFILGSALESTEAYFIDDRSKQQLQYHDHCQQRSLDLYILSAKNGNTNAINRLGNLCKDSNVYLSQSQTLQILGLLDELTKTQEGTIAVVGDSNSGEIDPVLRKLDLDKKKLIETTQTKNKGEDRYGARQDTKNQLIDDSYVSSDNMARQLWYEAAKQGNLLAQVSLAEECFEVATDLISKGNNDYPTTEGYKTNFSFPSLVNVFTMAAVLYVLAAQQRDHSAKISLETFVRFCNEEEKSGRSSSSQIEEKDLTTITDILTTIIKSGLVAYSQNDDDWLLSQKELLDSILKN